MTATMDSVLKDYQKLRTEAVASGIVLQAVAELVEEESEKLDKDTRYRLQSLAMRISEEGQKLLSVCRVNL